MKRPPKSLPLANWLETKITLHLFLQIVGKIRMTLHPKRNHWWHVTLYVTASGLTTGLIPYQAGVFQIDFDFLTHQLLIKTSRGECETITLANLTVADFYQHVCMALSRLDISVSISEKPFDPERVKSDILFSQDHTHQYASPESVQHFWHMLVWIYPIFQKFGGQFEGKTTPVHLFWHSMDYVITRFSGRKAPKMDGMDPVAAEAYSHEVISFGFWMGDDNLPEPAFYSYTYPAPNNLSQQGLQPKEAIWLDVNNSPMAILKYQDILAHKNPEQVLMQFLQSAFNAGATLAKWPVP